jgi:hypothetical protein
MIWWHIDPLLGNDRETMNETTAIDMQQLRKYEKVLKSLVGSGPSATMEVLLEAVFCMCPLRGYITRPLELSVVSALQWSGASWLVSD